MNRTQNALSFLGFLLLFSTLLALLGLILFFPDKLWAGEVVVVEATGISLKSGQVLDDSQVLVLKEGEQVTLVGEDGSVRKLKGPYNQAPSTASGGIQISEALSALMSGQRNEYGVVRSKDNVIELPSPWIVDVTHSGKACVRSDIPIVFWRPRAYDPDSLTVMPVDRSWKARTTWPSGVLQIAVIFPLKENRTYIFTTGGRNTSVTLIKIPETLSNDKMRAAWMLEMNCVNQTRALLKTIQN